jgi:hypothetical protein
MNCMNIDLNIILAKEMLFWLILSLKKLKVRVGL